MQERTEPPGGPAAAVAAADAHVLDARRAWRGPVEGPAPSERSEWSARAAGCARALRSVRREMARRQADELRLVGRLAEEVAAIARVELASAPRVPGQPCDEQVIDCAVTGEVMAV
ncbi:MAG: hypothetical protein ACXV2H_10125, partial [Actinomycetes bacterium]